MRGRLALVVGCGVSLWELQTDAIWVLPVWKQRSGKIEVEVPMWPMYGWRD